MDEKKPRLVILLWGGILENVIADQELDVEILKVDVDEEAENEVIYRLETIEVDPQRVNNSFRNAEIFWKEEEKSSPPAEAI